MGQNVSKTAETIFGHEHLATTRWIVASLYGHTPLTNHRSSFSAVIQEGRHVFFIRFLKLCGSVPNLVQLEAIENLWFPERPWNINCEISIYYYVNLIEAKPVWKVLGVARTQGNWETM